jgi:hypothetical protein
MPWSRILPEILTDYKLLRKFPAFYTDLLFMIMFTIAYYSSLLLAI